MSNALSSIDSLDALNRQSIRAGAKASSKAAFSQLLSSSLARPKLDENGKPVKPEPDKSMPLKPFSPSDFAGGAFMPEHAPLKPFNPADPRTLATKELRPLDELDRIPGVKPDPSPEKDELTKQAEKWVAQTFFGTMLKQMRDSPFKSELFSGGRGGEAFSQMFDQTLADRMARGAGGKMVKSIVKAFERKAGAVSQVG